MKAMLLPRFFFSQDFAPFRPFLLGLAPRMRRFRRGEFLWRPGEPFSAVFYIDSGLVRSAVEGKRDRRTNSWHGPGTMYPVVHSEPFALESSITAEAVTDVGALEFTNDAVLSAIRRNPDFAVATIDFYSRYVNLLLFTSSSLTFAKTVSALAAVLLLLFENAPEAQLGRNEELRVTQTELAELLGIDRASLVRAMTILRSAGAIATARGVVKLVSIERLREAAREAQ